MTREEASARVRGAVISGVVAALICLVALIAIFNKAPITADGKQNIIAAWNLIHHGVFSTEEVEGRAPTPNMFREPAWPVLTAGVLLVSGRSDMTLEQLVSEQHLIFKTINAVLLSLLTGLATGLAWGWARRPWVGALVASTVAIFTLTTITRLVNMYNNDILASLLLLVASALLPVAFRGSRAGAIALGSVLGLLALTKAQFLFIALVPIVALALVSRKRAGWALLVFAVLVSPWIARNALLFGEPAIAERGKTVAAIRMTMAVEPPAGERACMLYAFTHPKWRPLVGKVLSLGRPDFNRDGFCGRFCREFTFGMGTPKAVCREPAEERRAWRSTQYFWIGMASGQEMEKHRMRMTDVAPPTLRTLGRYLATLPLFAWRGWSFSGSPWISLFLSLSVFVLLVTRRWSFALLAASSHLVHLAFTHNIPRYHAVEFGVMFVAFALVADRVIGLVVDRLRLRQEPAPAGGSVVPAA